MSAEFDIRSYMEELQENIKPYLKDRFFPSDPVDRVIDELNEKYDADEDDITDIITPAFRKLGLQAIGVDEDDYLAPGASEEEIYDTLIGYIEKNDLDADMIYFLGVDDFSKKHNDLFAKMVNIVYFAVEDLRLGMQVIARTSYLLRYALQAHHLKLYPQDAERCRGWVDEETIDIIGPFFKDGHIPGWVYEEVLRDLVAELGDYPLSQNVMELSLNAMGANTLFLAKDYWLPVGSNAEAILAKLHKLLTDSGIDLDLCFTNGLQILPLDVQEFARNIVFFGDAGATTLYQAELTSGSLLTRLIEGDRARRHPDERVTTDVVNRDVAMALRMYAKDGYVPSFVVSNEYNKLIDKTHNAADAAAIRDGTMASLDLKTLMLSADVYLPTGTSRENIRQTVFSHIRTWNLDRIYETGAVPDENTAAHNDLVSMIFFADSGIHDLHTANEFFWNCLLPAIGEYRRAQGEGVPEQVLSDMQAVCLQWQKKGLIPSFLRQAAVDTLLSYVTREWYADYLYTQILDCCGIEEIEVDGPDYLAPQDAANLGAHVAGLIAQYGFDLEYISRNSTIHEADIQKKTLLANMLYFAVSDIDSPADADAYAAQLLLDYARHTQSSHHRRMRRTYS